MIKSELIDPSEIPLTVKNVNVTYINLLMENHHTPVKENYRRYLKQLLSENIPDIEFIKLVRKNESERICSTNLIHKSVDKYYHNINDQIKTIYNAAKIIREEILSKEAWEFKGTFSDYEPCKLLEPFLKWIITGPQNTMNSDTRNHEVKQDISRLSQIISQCTKTKRQI